MKNLSKLETKYQEYLGLIKKLHYFELQWDIDEDECRAIRSRMKELWHHFNDSKKENLQAASQILKKKTLDIARNHVEVCEKCAVLSKSRTHTVFGEGAYDAEVVFLGEAPGADEDSSGLPFVGKAGSLLNDYIEAAKLKRDDCYILNVLKCRPPHNRPPRPLETANCRRYLEIQLKCINPAFIICLGAVAAQNLLRTSRPLKALRGVWHIYKNSKVICTYHPAFLLRNPLKKNEAWEDWVMFIKERERK